MTDIYSFRAARITEMCLFGFAISLFAGCGGGDEFSTASVTGKVTMNGQPVTEGSITFSPIATGGSEIVGKPASGDIQKDGTFTLTTYEENDGAVIGKHRVIYSLPMASPTAAPDGGHAAPPKQSNYAGAVPITPEVEVTSGGENHFEIEIGRPS